MTKQNLEEQLTARRYVYCKKCSSLHSALRLPDDGLQSVSGLPFVSFILYILSSYPFPGRIRSFCSMVLMCLANIYVTTSRGSLSLTSCDTRTRHSWSRYWQSPDKSNQAEPTRQAGDRFINLFEMISAALKIPSATLVTKVPDVISFPRHVTAPVRGWGSKR